MERAGRLALTVMRSRAGLHRHAALPDVNHDEQARQDFVYHLRGHLSAKVMPGNYRVIKRHDLPATASSQLIRTAMESDPYYQFWSAMQRRSQELMWESAIDPVERAQHSTRRGGAPRKRVKLLGSLRLDPQLPIPRYQSAVDIHLQPGGYHTDYRVTDTSAGAIYDQALYIYSHGANGLRNESMGALLVKFYRERFSQAAPRNILELGCGIGNSLLPWVESFPRASVHGVDIGAPMLRYAHVRASGLGAAVHWSQQNAEATDFESGSFDLVLSHLLLHETSRSALPRILSECHRLLRPGGVMLHLEIPRGDTPVEQFFYNWEVHNNNETFAQFMTGLDLAPLAVAAGFSADKAQMVRYARPREAGQHLYGETFFWNILMAIR